MSVSIKISEENYKNIVALTGQLREKWHKPVSINKAISFLYKRRKLSDLAGTWDMKDSEAKEFVENLKKGWGRWKTKSA